MRALICDDFEGIDALRVGELPEPKPGPGSVLIEVESVAVNFADTLMVTGQYQLQPETPFAPGYEVAGTVIVANQTAGVSPGDRVCGFTWYGAMAERVVLLAANTTPLPDAVPFDVGATLSGTYGTAFHALVDRAALQDHENLLVLGAAGGVGTAAVQVGKALGATVVAAVSSPEKAAFVSKAGADKIIRYDETPLREGIEQATDGQGIDVVFDPVGGESTELALRSTRWGGRVLVIGFAAGKIPEVPLNIPLLKGNSIMGVFWGRFASEHPDHHRTNEHQIVRWVEEGRLSPIIQKTYPLDDAKEAMRWVFDRKAMGRVIVNP